MTYATLWVHDSATDIGRAFLLGEFHEVYREAFVVGRDPTCDVIIDDPGVPLRAAEIVGMGHHRCARLLPDGSFSRGSVQIGRFRVGPSETKSLTDLARPGELPVRFGGRRGIGRMHRDLREAPADEARRVIDAVRTGDHARRLDSATERWCEELVTAHVAALSWVTSPLPPLVRGRIEYTSSAVDACERWSLAWGAVAQLPFSRAAWAHVHRADRWAGSLAHAHEAHLQHADGISNDAFTTWTGIRLQQMIGSSLARIRLIQLARQALALHLATLADDVSPARPLIELIERRIFPLALPGGAMVLYFDAADGDVVHTSERGEVDFVRAIARDPEDVAMRHVYADYLEERGELARASVLRMLPLDRRDALPPNVYELFPHASWIVPLHPTSHREELVPPTSGDSAPRARIELANRSLPLGSDGRLVWRDGAARVVDGAVGEHEAYVRIFHADDTLWLEVPRDVTATLNGRYVNGSVRPLFDRDELAVRVHARRHVDGVIRYDRNDEGRRD